MTTTTQEHFSKFIDHTLLKPEATGQQFQDLCREAVQYHFMSVCVPPNYVKFSKQVLAELKDSSVKVCTVIGFPLGYATTETKIFEIKNALENGADEIDLVINISNVKSNQFELIKEELGLARAACGDHCLKIIFETALLSKEEIIRLCGLCSEARVDFVKTSTGFSTRGASQEDILLMKENISPGVKIKASGGIRTYEDAVAFLNAGAERLGTSGAVAMLKGLSHQDAY